MKLSVVIITYNEEKNIERCLKSVLEIADEIVVLDSFSADETENICKKYSAKFYAHKFDGHIEQKNRAITYTENDFILSLDADEALDENLIQSILEIKNHLKADGYSMNRLTNYCGKWIKHCGWYPDTKLRLWNKHKGSWTGINPHDKYEMQNGCKTLHLKGNILHYSYYTVDDHYRQVEYFTTISAKAYHAKGKRSNWFLMMLSPIIKFLRDYIFKLGILDGKYGFIICKISAYATYLKYKKLYRLQHEK